MTTVTNYGSGEIMLADGSGHSLRLARDPANRLIMTARMHAVVEFVEKLPALIPDEKIVKRILAAFEGKSSSERWNLKEKFARLQTLSKSYQPNKPEVVVETVTI